MSNKLTTEEIIKNFKKVHGDKYDYSQVEYVNSRTKVKIICKEHGQFEQNVSNHKYSGGCYKCRNVKISKRLLKTQNEFIIDAVKIHGNKYNYSKVDYDKSRSKVIIICPKHGEFTQKANSHLQGKGCTTCGYELNSSKNRKSTEKFIEEAMQKHGIKYDYSQVEYINSKTKVKIICPDHGEFETTPSSHIDSTSGCGKCGQLKAGQSNAKSIEKFIEEAIQKHGTKYDYSKVDYINTNTKVIIICPEHGEVSQSPKCHLNGCGCGKCSGKLVKSKQEFIKDATSIHGIKKYDYSLVKYKRAHTKIKIICYKHGEFNQTPNSHLKGLEGCSRCRSCPSCGLWITEGNLCSYCKKPEKGTNKLYTKTKEMAVVKFLKDNLPNHDFIHNRSVGNECNDKKTHLYPDIRFDCIFYNLIVEIDEFQHRGASYSCDEKRMMDIIAKLGQPCIFIRYNPDSKDTDKNKLLEKVNEYLNIKIKDKSYCWNDYGFKVEYMFYKTK